jgi:chromosome segregation ATPase
MTPEELDKAIKKAEAAVAYHLRDADRIAAERDKLAEKVERARVALAGAEAALDANPASEAQARRDAADAESRVAELRGNVAPDPNVGASAAAFNASVHTEEN